MLMSKVPEWLNEPDIRTYSIEVFILDYVMYGERTSKTGYLLTLHRNGKIRQCHFMTNKKKAESVGKKYMKEQGISIDN
jgi:hypothetical protein